MISKPKARTRCITLKKSIRTVEELKKYIPLTRKEEKRLREVVSIHPMKITKYYLSLVNKDDPNDPIRKLIVPSEEELCEDGEYDVSDEKKNIKTKGLQHKYEQTAVIFPTNRCMTYCRFCFRKRLVGISQKGVLRRFDDALNYIKENKGINNVLISGGDPLILPTKTIKVFLEELSKIKHIDFIRLGTRIPVVYPDRILKDRSLLRLLKKYSEKKRIYLVTHFNHPREITSESIEVINKLIKSNIIINNQTVLLKGVNDSPDILSTLLNELVRIGVNPYYVFQCRPVKRVKGHFQVPLYKGYKIVEEAKKNLSGHSKRFKYVMSHSTGKIEIAGIEGDEIFLKYHQAKDPKDIGKFFKKKLSKKAAWLDELT